MKTVQLRNGTTWDRCRSCGRTWDQTNHSSLAQCRRCRRLEKETDSSIQPVCLDYSFLEPELKDSILHEETKSKYGYEINSLSYGSPKPIIHKCPECSFPKDTPFKLFIQGKNLRHTKCKVRQTRKTNQKRYGVINSCNIPERVRARLEEKNEEIIKSFSKKEYKVRYIERNSKKEIIVHFTCPRSHEHKITWSAWKVDDQECGKCFGNNNKITIEIIRQSFKSEGYILHTQSYEDNKTRLSYTCPKGHHRITSWKIWDRGCRCPLDNPCTSKGEEEIREMFKHLNPVKTQAIIKPKELDVYFSDQKVAIEYCGLFWHCDAQGRMYPKYHREKLDLCNKQDIRLLTIFEDEWKNHKDVCISRINSALGIVQNKIFARKCQARLISCREAHLFLQRTHLQGPGGCKVAYGLFYDNKLVQVMTFGSPNRAHTSKGKRVLEMKRLAGELNTIIVGGASKLFKLGLQYAKQNNYEIIKSYCDLRWGTGNLYQKLGFMKTSDGSPSYHWTDGTKRWRNQKFAQNKQKTGITEAETASKKGCWKIYDCGDQTWEYKV